MAFNIKQIRRILIGRPLSTDEAAHQAISKIIALAVFASDALSSVGYAPGEILLVLLAAGVAATAYALPVALAIVILLAILTISYRQTIFAYPSGGGAYIVSRDNLGEYPALIAGAALLIDYVLTVAVSITSGWENVSATFPFFKPYQVVLSSVTVVFMMLINLRGVKESGRAFAIPTYFFIITLFVTLAVGFYRYFTGTLPIVPHTEEQMEALKHSTQAIGALLVLRAFSSGCTALTGVEAISNGIPAFKEPKSKNAANTMLAMSTLIAINLLGIVFLAYRMQVLPEIAVDANGHLEGSPALLPFITAALVGTDHILHWALVIATMLILIMAANTSFADFPRLSSIMASDGFLPRQLGFRGSRLVFSWGITGLTLASIFLIILFEGQTTRLIPLYAIGVFLGFGLSQAGMVIHWLRTSKLKAGEKIKTKYGTLHHDAHWWVKLIINAIGMVLSFVVMVVFAVTKFTQGAYITVILIPLLVFVLSRIHRHYKDVARILSLNTQKVNPIKHDILTIVFVDDVHAGTVPMVEFAMSMRHPWLAVHIDNDASKTELVKAKWDERMKYASHPLVIEPAPFRNLTEVLVGYVQRHLDKDPKRLIHVVMGQLVMDTWPAQALHANTGLAFRFALQRMERVIVTDVSYQLHSDNANELPHNEENSYKLPHQRGEHAHSDAHETHSTLAPTAAEVKDKPAHTDNKPHHPLE